MKYQKLLLATLLFSPFLLCAQASKILINEVMASNVSTLRSETTEFAAYIEIYNTTSSPFYFNEIYLSDDITFLKKYRFPSASSVGANKHVIVWCDNLSANYHALFKIDSDGETIYLSKGDGIILDSITLGKQYNDIPYGRFPDGGEWNYMEKGSPGKSNVSPASTRLTSVVFNSEGGFYPSKHTLVLTQSESAEIRYTINGEYPNENSLLYEKPIEISKTTVVRACAIKKGYLPSEVITKTFFILSREIHLPVFSIATDPKNFFSDTFGIYVAGTNGKTGMCSTVPVNWNMDWERPVNIEYFDKNKTNQINQLSGVKINGNCSRLQKQKSLAFYDRSQYNTPAYTTEFFESKNQQTRNTILLRNSGNEWNQTMLRDAFHQTLIQNVLDIDYMAYQPSVMFLNGEYWGIHNIREKHGNDLIESNYGISSDSMDVLQSNASVFTGSNAHYNAMINYLKSNDISQAQHYDYIKTQMDVNNYLDFSITQLFISNTDWPGNNIEFWRPHRPDGKWRWVIFDTDFGFGFSKAPSFDMHSYATMEGGTAWPNPDWSTYLLRTLLKNDAFKKEFINRSVVYYGSVFRSERINHILDSMAANIEDEIPYHMTRWNGNDINVWRKRISDMKVWGEKRHDFVYEHLASFFGFDSPCALDIHSSIHGAAFKVNEVLSPDTVFEGKFFKNKHLKIQAISPPGYKFDHWKVKYGNTFVVDLISNDDYWLYYDYGSAPEANWTSEVFDESIWKYGQSELGYGDNDEKTVITYGPSSTNKFITYYFRKKITIPDTASIAEVTMSTIIDDGAVIYLNGKEINRINMPAGIISNSTLALAANDNYTTTFNINKKDLVEGINTIAVSVHQSSASSSDVSFNLSMYYAETGYVPNDTIINAEIFSDTIKYGMSFTAFYTEDTCSKRVLINEICASNKTEKDDYGGTDDWIELYNPTDDSVDVGGMFITDDLTLPLKQMIPIGYAHLTTIAPKSFLRVWADSQHYQGKLHVNVQLNNLSESVGICQRKGDKTVWIDSITYGFQDYQYSYGRYQDGSNKWMLMPMTPNATNQKGYLIDSTIRFISINEIDASNTTYPDQYGQYHDWIELFNPSDDTVDIAGLLLSDSYQSIPKSRIPYDYPDQTKIPPGEYRILWCNNESFLGPLHLDFKLNKVGERVSIIQQTTYGLFITDSITYPPHVYGYSFGRIPDGSDSLFYMELTPNASNIKKITPPETITLQNLLSCQAYPNPAGSYIHVSTDIQNNAVLTIYSLSGNKVVDRYLDTKEQLLDLKGLPEGYYVIKIIDGQNTCIIPFIKY